jgi:hypothetical protein
LVATRCGKTVGKTVQGQGPTGITNGGRVKIKNLQAPGVLRFKERDELDRPA